MKGGDLSDGLSHWNAKRYGEASSKLKTALNDSPSAADDADLARTLAGSLRDREAQREVGSLMSSTPLGRSRGMAESLAGVALGGERDERDASLDLLRNRHSLLSSEQRARIALRDSNDCDALQSALSSLVVLGPGPGQDDIRKLSSRDCKELLRRGDLCQQCLKKGGQGRGKKGDD
jgi:hypothetical protein